LVLIAGAMRYVCLNCGHRFALEEGEKVRCTSCLRVTGIEKLAEAAPSRPARPPWLVPGAALIVLAAAVGGFAVWRSGAHREVGEEVAMSPLEHDALLGHLRRLRTEARGLTNLLEADEATEQMAERATEGRRTPTEMAEGVLAAIRGRAAAQAFVRWSLGVPREAGIVEAATVREWIGEDGARKRLYPLEAAALMVAMLRSRGVDAMLAQAWAFPGDGAPPDPSGHFGYFVVAVPQGEGEPHLYDPWGGHEVAPATGFFQLVSDVEAIGAALNIRALHLLVRESDASRAMTASSEAVRLAPRSPEARCVRGAILIASGGANEGVAEFEAARQIRADAPRQQLLAGVFLAQGDVGAARRALSAALELSPDYAAAHGTLAAVHLSEGEPDLALEQLQTAQRNDPDLHTLPGLWAGYHATVGENEQAVESAREAVERNPWDVQTRLMAARIYRQAGRFEDMRREAREVVERTPSGQRQDMEQLVRRLLGATALEAPLEDEPLEDEPLEDEPLGDDDDSFQLGAGDRPLGTPGAGRPSLLDDGAGAAVPPGGVDPLPSLGDPSRLQLGGSGGGNRPRLDLGGD